MCIIYKAVCKEANAESELKVLFIGCIRGPRIILLFIETLRPREITLLSSRIYSFLCVVRDADIQILWAGITILFIIRAESIRFHMGEMKFAVLKHVGCGEEIFMLGASIWYTIVIVARGRKLR